MVGLGDNFPENTNLSSQEINLLSGAPVLFIVMMKKRVPQMKAFLFEALVFVFFTGVATFSVYFLARFVLGI
jgi:hypothetical protein